jgi:hypothetical protein
MQQHTPAPSWPTPPPPDAEQAAAFAAYDQLPPAERARVARLVASTGCSIALAVAAVKATRPAD